MLLAFLVAFQLGSAAPRDAASFQFVSIAEDGASDRVLEQMLRGIQGARRSAADTQQFTHCLARTPVTYVNRCLRALLRNTSEADPLIAFTIQDVVSSNITGTQRAHRQTLWCIASRGIGRIQLPGSRSTELIPASEFQIRSCVADALGRNEGPVETRNIDGSAGWHLSMNEADLTVDASQARWSTSDQPIVEVLEAVPPHNGTGRCSLRGAIVYVEAGDRLRAGDRVEFEAPCIYDGADPVSRMFSQARLHGGQSVRIYVRSDRDALRFLEGL